MTVYIFHSAQPATGPQRADTIGYLFDKKGTDHLHNQFEKDRGQHPGIVALSGGFVKKGKRQTVGLANPPTFPVFAIAALLRRMQGL
jgi:hypothetical protein